MFFEIACLSWSAGNTEWSARQKDNIVEIGYGSGTSFPQYAALHMNSSYLRLNHGLGSGWGTSAVLLPSFWTGGAYFQGAKIALASMEVESGDLVIHCSGTIASLGVEGNIRIKPPT